MLSSSADIAFQPMQDYFGLSALVSRVNSTNVNGIDSRIRNRSLSSGDSSTLSSLSDTDMYMDRLRFEFRTNGIDCEFDAEENSVCSGFQPFNLDFLDKRKIGTKKGGRRRLTPDWCVFCKNNGEVENVYLSHVLKSSDGKVKCPILRKYTCPICGINGDFAHTIKYCPNNREDGNSSIRTSRTSTGRKE